MNFLELLTVVAPVFLVILAGLGIRFAGWLSTEADGSLLKVVVNLLFPCLILKTLLGNASLENPANVVLAPVAGFVTVAAGFGVCYWLAPLFGIRDSLSRRTFGFTAGLYNYGYIPLPLIQKFFGEATAGVLFLHNVGVESAMWTLGVAMLSGTSPRQAWRHIISVPVIAIATALTLNALGARTWMPAWVLHAVEMMAASAIPLGLILTGAVFADQMTKTGPPAGDERGISLGACALRLAVLPAAQLALAWCAPVSLELRQVMMVQAAMPSAVIPVILARHYGGSGPVALRIVLVTTAVGLVTIPLWLKLGMGLLPTH